MIRKLYPYGKKKAFNVTYDDGVEQDIRFVKLLNQYGLKGTFNLNSTLMENGFAWTHECGLVVKRLRTEDAVFLYAGHEIASHTLTHPYMNSLTKDEILHELSQDKANLEKLFCTEIQGFAVPFHYYNQLIAQCVQASGFDYARISEESYSFAPQDDYYHWKATIFHCCDNLEDWTHRFLATDEELALFQIVGHSYDLEVENKWERMEEIFSLISRQDDVLPMTTMEIIDYLKAMRAAQITDAHIKNNSSISLWFDIDNVTCEIGPNEAFVLH